MLAFEDIIIAAIVALILTWIVSNVRKLRRLLKKPVEPVGTQEKILKKALELNKIVQKCYHMFPKDKVMFGDMTVTRGEFIRVKTTENEVIEGKFLGLNHKNVICIITKVNIVAHKMDNTQDIAIIDHVEL